MFLVQNGLLRYLFFSLLFRKTFYDFVKIGQFNIVFYYPGLGGFLHFPFSIGGNFGRGGAPKIFSPFFFFAGSLCGFKRDMTPRGGGPLFFPSSPLF